jgi:hypothetical protein
MMRGTEERFVDGWLVADAALGVYTATPAALVEFEFLPADAALVFVRVGEAELGTRVVSSNVVRTTHEFVRFLRDMGALERSPVISIGRELEVRVGASETQILSEVRFEFPPMFRQDVGQGNPIYSPVRTGGSADSAAIAGRTRGVQPSHDFSGTFAGLADGSAAPGSLTCGTLLATFEHAPGAVTGEAFVLGNNHVPVARLTRGESPFLGVAVATMTCMRCPLLRDLDERDGRPLSALAAGVRTNPAADAATGHSVVYVIAFALVSALPLSDLSIVRSAELDLTDQRNVDVPRRRFSRVVRATAWEVELFIVSLGYSFQDQHRIS